MLTNEPPRLPPRRRGPTLSSGMLGALVGLFVLATALSGYLVFAAVRDAVADFRITDNNAVGPDTSGAGGGGNNGGSPGSGASPGSLIPQKWSGTDRVTVLIMGIDRRVTDTDTAYRTDTMMLVSVDPVARTAVMLSIPRDLWVEVPGYDLNTINTANFTGDAFLYPGGGPALAVKTVEHNLGVTVNYYVRLDFTAFETFVEALGGIEVDVAQEINDPWYPDGAYGYEPFYLPAGRQHLNGHDALRYARTRHDSSDIERAKRQQQVVMAVRDRVLSFNLLPTLIARAPSLYQTLNASIQTDLSLDQIVSLALLAQDIPPENITQEVIDYRYVLDYTTPEGRQVLVPLRDKIRELRDALFTASAPISPPSGVDEKTLIAAEAARVEVLNGAGVDGLARATTEWLEGQGLHVVNYATADRSDYANSVIVNYTGKPYTTGWLARAFNVTTIISGNDPNSPVDVRLILGADWRVPSGTTP
jgi:LCP family protein required for cell wall assembly